MTLHAPVDVNGTGAQKGEKGNTKKKKKKKRCEAYSSALCPTWGLPAGFEALLNDATRADPSLTTCPALVSREPAVWDCGLCGNSGNLVSLFFLQRRHCKKRTKCINLPSIQPNIRITARRPALRTRVNDASSSSTVTSRVGGPKGAQSRNRGRGEYEEA